MVSYLKEACVETLDEALIAEQNGAHRLELCANLDQDGLTPPEELIRKVTQSVNIPVKVMIRPRAGDFVYTEAEIEAMKISISCCKQHRVSGIVFGILDQKNQLNTSQVKAIAQYASPLAVTVHKAIDNTPDLLQSVHVLKSLGSINSILTSGGFNTAIDGYKMLKKMIAAAGSSLTIIAAGKITKYNIWELHELIGATEYHGKRIV